MEYGVQVVEIGKLALLAPTGTVTPAGTVTTPSFLLKREIPTGASATSSRVTVPVAAVPPGTLAGLTVRDARALAGFRISVEDSVDPASVAVIVTGVGTATGLVSTSKLPSCPRPSRWPERSPASGRC